MTHTGQDPSHFFCGNKETPSKFIRFSIITACRNRTCRADGTQSACNVLGFHALGQPGGSKLQGGNDKTIETIPKSSTMEKMGWKLFELSQQQTTYPSPRNFMKMFEPPKEPWRWWKIFISFPSGSLRKLENRLTTVAPALAKKPGKTRWPGLLVSEQL